MHVCLQILHGLNGVHEFHLSFPEHDWTFLHGHGTALNMEEHEAESVHQALGFQPQ